MDAQGSPWSPNGGRLVLTVIVQGTLFEAQRWHRGGIREAEASTTLGTGLCSRTHLLHGDHWPTIVHPFCNHGDAAAFLFPHASNHWATNLLGDPSATVLNTFKTWWWPWRPWRLLKRPTFERPRQPCRIPLSLKWRPDQFMVAR